MDCRDAQRFVELRLDGEIEATDCAMLDRHLESCEVCRSRVDAEHRLKSLVSGKLKERVQAEAPSGLKSRILTTARREERAHRFPIGRAIGVVLGVSAIAALGRSSTSSEPSIVEQTVLRHSSNLPPEVRARISEEDPEVDRFLETNLRYRVPVPRF